MAPVVVASTTIGTIQRRRRRFYNNIDDNRAETTTAATILVPEDNGGDESEKSDMGITTTTTNTINSKSNSNSKRNGLCRIYANVTTTTNNIPTNNNDHVHDHDAPTSAVVRTITTTTTTTTTTPQPEDGALSSSSYYNSYSHSYSAAKWYAVTAITMANALHFGAYELARSAIAALFTSSSLFMMMTTTTTTTVPSSTSSSLNNNNNSNNNMMTMTLAIACVSPCSILFLTIHRKVFDRYGPQLALRYTTLVYALSLSMAAVLLRYCCCGTGVTTGHTVSSSPSSRTIVAQWTILTIFIVKNSFVQLLASQHWSFITGILTTTAPATTPPTTTSSSSAAASALRQQSQLPQQDHSFENKWGYFSWNTKTNQKQRKKQQPRPAVVVWDLNGDTSTTMIAGIASVVATICGWMVGPFLRWFEQTNNNNTTTTNNNNNYTSTNGLTGLLLCAAAIMMMSTICSDEAYRTATKYNFAPTGKFNKNTSTTSTSPTTTVSLYRRAQTLFQTVPVLYILCYEVLISQGVSSLLSYMFMSYTKQSIPLDTDRASHTGKVYGRINLCSGLLQFAIIPFLFGGRRGRRNDDDRSRSDRPKGNNGNNNDMTTTTTTSTSTSHPPHRRQHKGKRVDWYWLLLPSVLCMAAMGMIRQAAVQSTISVENIARTTSTTDWANRFNLITMSFSTMKVLEYSLRVSLVERVYVPLNDDDRFLGKEIVGMIANRFGKSFSAVLLAVATSIIPNFLSYAPFPLLCLSFIWLLISILLVQLLSKQKEKVE